MKSFLTCYFFLFCATKLLASYDYEIQGFETIFKTKQDDHIKVELDDQWLSSNLIEIDDMNAFMSSNSLLEIHEAYDLISFTKLHSGLCNEDPKAIYMALVTTARYWNFIEKVFKLHTERATGVLFTAYNALRYMYIGTEEMKQFGRYGGSTRVAAREAIAGQEHRPMAAQVAVSGHAILTERQEEMAGVQGAAA